VADGRDVAAPGDAYDLRGLVDHRLPAQLRQRLQRGGDVGRGEIVKHDQRIGFEVALHGERVPRRRLAVVVAIDECEGPFHAALAKTDDVLGTCSGDEGHAADVAGAVEARDEFASPVVVLQQRLDDVQRSQARGQQMAGRPAAPRADLDSAAARKKLRARIEDRRLVLVDEADLRMPPIDVPFVIDLLAEMRPGDAGDIADDHVREQMRQVRRMKVGRHVIL